MVKIDKEKCIGCGACIIDFPEIFEIVDGKADVNKDISTTKEMKEICSMEAIE